MKLNANLLSLAALAALPSMVHAAPPTTCDEWKPCIEFSMTKLNADACGIGGACTIEVCMTVDGSRSECIKNSATESFSHMCTQTGSSGCPAWSDTAQTIPIMGPEVDDTSVSTRGDCSLSGQGSGVGAFGGKCSGNEVLMCQEGKPGQTLYWTLKDGSDQTEEHPTYSMDYKDGNGAATGCSASVSCGNYNYKCGATGSDTQKKFERTFGFTIPDGTNGSCDACGSTPTPAPNAPIAPTPVITPASPTRTPTNENTTPTPGSNGDPHFKTWKNEHFEYHGQCDLVLTKDANFADGLGLDIQLRTKLVRYWSYIRNAAVRIGHDIIELEGSDDLQDQSVRYWYNMQFRSDEAKTLGGFPMTILRSHSKLTKIEIDLNSKYPGVKIVMSTYKEFVKVEVQGATEEAFGNSVGLLGDFKTGKTLARDGKKYIHDFREYGSEWQVTPMEDMLFHSTEEPQFPKKCLEPEDPRGERRRRLDESDITLEQAEKACARLTDPLDRKDCVYDILATQDVDMVGAF
eukprot:CAMPEP_0113639850 /NCGR_PEP_ID=MMETSP0017_2-20120614/20913_1 /TAXON_ID=2856 /ORGANISM="Cylindrotheca closterium" /LENGTH=517 /DNA_ID=CAMNT_0000551099 /DNA_START=1025 /DNA_END=2578 /DNA_ORIENTATION=- /assembly_acc=CAM_ASM_000147